MVKNKNLTKKWTKGQDFMDTTPRYTFEGRDPQDTLAPIQVVVYQVKEREYPTDSTSVKKFYYANVRHEPTETANTIGRYALLKTAKEEAEKLFYRYCEEYPNDTNA